MQTFIDDVLAHTLQTADFPLADTTFVLPGKRAGAFLQTRLKDKIKANTFAPEVWSIEEFIGDITGLNLLDNTNSLFRFYEIYKDHTPKSDQEDFETFYSWAQTLIYDFNEIDRFLIDTPDFFDYLGQIQDINHWSLQNDQTELVKNYLKFWNKLPEYHTAFVHSILDNKEAYQGLMYRQAARGISSYLNSTKNNIIFIGFNALNKAEQIIIQTVLNKNRGEVFWDIDQSFFEDKQHEAGLFLRKYHQEWPCYSERQNDFNWLGQNYAKPKYIESIGIPKNIGQAKYVANILQDLAKTDKLANTALILNDEGLLAPILNSLPESVKDINITMGLPLQSTPLASLFETLFSIQEQENKSFYYKNILEIINHPTITPALEGVSNPLQDEITTKNLVFVSLENLLKLTDKKVHPLLKLCFSDYREQPLKFLKAVTRLTDLLRPKQKDRVLEREYLFHFNAVFKKLRNLLDRYNPLKTIKALHQVYNDILQTETLDFRGSPFQGLQLMGMLETRVLDFETVILTAVNEGVLPSGKTNNSFIPYDLKMEYNLPTYKEKDAIYSYHFYRLFQRAKSIYLLHNTDNSGVNSGEKSRFVTQLEVESPEHHKFIERNIAPAVVSTPSTLQEIKKTPEALEKLKKLAKVGFSPSALTTYIRNPIDFYKKYILNIGDPEEVEETVAANTLGTVVHNALEEFYKPYTGQTLTPTDIDKMYAQIENQVKFQFEENYKKAPLTEGKNLIIYEVAQRYLQNFLQKEKQGVKHHDLKIIQIEDKKLKEPLKIDQFNFPIYIRGKVDRVDEIDGYRRVVDYKTGNVERRELNLYDWDKLTEDYKYAKAFQVLSYTSMIAQNKRDFKAQGGIISLKKLSEDFMPFAQKESSRKKGITQIDGNVLRVFHRELRKLIGELFDPEIPFVEKEV